jgi:hypothetical protein
LRRPSPRLLLLPLVGALVLLSACGQQTQPTGYGQDYKDNFMFGCNQQSKMYDDPGGGPQAPKDYCNCVYKGLVEKVPFDDAKKFEEQQADEKAGQIKVPKNIQTVFDSCKSAGA